jgi:hypothetical protein
MLQLALWLPALRIAVTPAAEAKQVSVRPRVSANLKPRLVVPESRRRGLATAEASLRQAEDQNYRPSLGIARKASRGLRN